MTKLIIANWKMNPSTLAEAQELFKAEAIEAAKYKNIKTVICPPTMFLKELAAIPNQVLGSQDVFWEESEIFEPQKLGINYVLVGHSDRRYPPAGEGENDVVINKKLKTALLADITPVLLVGERERGNDRERILSEQLTTDLNGLTNEEISKVLIAYEPVWAISRPDAEIAPVLSAKSREDGRNGQNNVGSREYSTSGNVGTGASTPENTLAAMKIISDIMSKTYNLTPENYLYGGSVNGENIAGFLSHPEISGAVIGAASLRKEEFARMLRISASL